jgi:hypothetical protein
MGMALHLLEGEESADDARLRVDAARLGLGRVTQARELHTPLQGMVMSGRWRENC